MVCSAFALLQLCGLCDEKRRERGLLSALAAFFRLPPRHLPPPCSASCARSNRSVPPRARSALSCYPGRLCEVGIYATRFICGFCSHEQPMGSKKLGGTCKHCGRSTTGGSKGKSHWEGGKGMRDKTRMSNKDRAKYRGANKTRANGPGK